MSKKKKKLGICVYCGESKEVTREHVIPRCMFPGPLPNDVVVVPACEPCNKEKGKHDDYLRDMLTVDAQTSASDSAQTVLTGKVFRAAEKNHSQLIRAAKAKGKFEPVHSSGGIYLGHGYAVPLEEDRVNHIFSLIVRGLYFKTTGLLLPQDAVFEVKRLEAADFDKTWKHLQKIGYNGPYHLDDVLTCIFVYASEEPAVSHWWLWFYGSICVYVSTQPPGFDINSLTPNRGVGEPKLRVK
ncbi:hypothetical protein BH10ACI3_BH10ACI3_26290 [soil metagenome]